MDFVDGLRVLVRRWYVLVAGGLVLCVAIVGVFHWVPTKYQASGEVLLLLRVDVNGPSQPTNPYLNSQAGLTTTASLIANTVSSNETHQSLARRGYRADYSVALDPDSGPLLVVTANDADPVAAERTRDEVIKRLDRQLNYLQHVVKVPARQEIQILPTSPGLPAQVVPGSKVRALGALGLLIGFATLWTAFAVDRRSRRRQLVLDGSLPSRTDSVGERRHARSTADNAMTPEVGGAPDTMDPDAVSLAQKGSGGRRVGTSREASRGRPR